MELYKLQNTERLQIDVRECGNRIFQLENDVMNALWKFFVLLRLLVKRMKIVALLSGRKGGQY